MSRTSATSSLELIFLAEDDGTGVLGAPLLAVLVLVALIVVSVARACEFWLRQLRPMCPVRLHLKHLPSRRNWAISSSVSAALARVRPGVRSMALGSLAKRCCHCCCVGQVFQMQAHRTH